MEMRNTHIEVSALASALRAEVGGVDLSRPLPEEVHGEVLDALHDTALRSSRRPRRRGRRRAHWYRDGEMARVMALE